jgi:preprotein translocase subunit SecD
MRQAAEVGWSTTRRTLLAADFVTLLAAIVLYIISVGNVKGFAFTLGLITLIDIFVAFLFTYPLTVLICRSGWMQKGTWLTGLRTKRSDREPGADAAADDRTTVGVES